MAPGSHGKTLVDLVVCSRMKLSSNCTSYLLSSSQSPARVMNGFDLPITMP